MFRIERVDETESTNDDAQRLLGERDGAGVAIVARYQRAGKGRRPGRRWVAPPGAALLCTTTLPEPLHTSSLWVLPFWVGLAVADAIEDAAARRPALQWPNDLLLDGRKVGGILCISRVSGDEAWPGCGVGVNVRRPPDDAELAAIEPAPAFLDDGVPHDDETPRAHPDVLLAALLAAYERRLPELARPERIARAWEARASLAGTPYRLLVDGEDLPFDATALGLSSDGGLRVATANGERVVSLADARVLRGATSSVEGSG